MSRQRTLEEDRQFLADCLARARALSGKSQEYMALELGVTRKTIRSWESAISVPSFQQTMEWYRIVGISPIPDVIRYVFPDVEGITDQDTDLILRKSLMTLLQQIPEEGVRQLLYLFYGDHGSSPRAIMNLINAHLQTPMKDRVTQAGVIIHNYELAQKKGTIVSPDHIKPDMPFLKAALEMGEDAFLRDEKSYRTETK